MTPGDLRIRRLFERACMGLVGAARTSPIGNVELCRRRVDLMWSVADMLGVYVADIVHAYNLARLAR